MKTKILIAVIAAVILSACNKQSVYPTNQVTFELTGEPESVIEIATNNVQVKLYASESPKTIKIPTTHKIYISRVAGNSTVKITANGKVYRLIEFNEQSIQEFTIKINRP